MIVKPKLKIHRDYIILFIIIILGAVLRLYNLGKYSLWKDEIFSVMRAKESLASVIFGSIPYDIRAPLHHIFIHIALYFGNNDFVVRFPSVIFGLLSIFLIYVLGKTIFNSKIGLIAAFLLTLSILHLEYSREARYYSYLIFFSSLTTFFFYKIIYNFRIKWIFFFIISNILNFSTHPMGLLITILEILPFFLITNLRRKFVNILRSFFKHKPVKSKKSFPFF